MDNLSDLRKEVMQMKSQLDAALDQVEANTRLFFEILENMRLLADWTMRWQSSLKKLPFDCYKEMDELMQRIAAIIRRDNVKSRVR